MKVRRDWLDRSGQCWTSSHGPASHCRTASLTRRARPTCSRASTNPNIDRRPSGPGSGSIRPQAANKEKAQDNLRGPHGTHAAPEGTCCPQGVVRQAWVCRCVSTRASPHPVGCTAGSPGRNGTKGQGVWVGPGGSRWFLVSPGSQGPARVTAFTCTSLSSTRRYSSRCR